MMVRIMGGVTRPGGLKNPNCDVHHVREWLDVGGLSTPSSKKGRFECAMTAFIYSMA